jgi:hypothetical protein
MDYFAHPGHHHLEHNISSALSQGVVIGVVAGVAILLVAGLVAIDMLKKKRSKPSPSK